MGTDSPNIRYPDICINSIARETLTTNIRLR